MMPPNQTSSLRSNPPPILTLHEAAQLSGYLRKEHISRAVSNGVLPHVLTRDADLCTLTTFCPGSTPLRPRPGGLPDEREVPQPETR
jgi:hypothetical protein